MLNKKAQVSLEILIVMGVLVIIAVVFATIYLNRMNANKTPDDNSSELIENMKAVKYEIIYEDSNYDSYCGNGVCEPTLGETHSSCSADC